MVQTGHAAASTACSRPGLRKTALILRPAVVARKSKTTAIASAAAEPAKTFGSQGPETTTTAPLPGLTIQKNKESARTPFVKWVTKALLVIANRVRDKWNAQNKASKEPGNSTKEDVSIVRRNERTNLENSHPASMAA